MQRERFGLIGGRLGVAFRFTITRDKIVKIGLIADTERLRQLDLVLKD